MTKIETLEVNPYIYCQIIFDKGAENMHCKERSF